MIDVLHQKISWSEYYRRVEATHADALVALHEEERRIDVTLNKENRQELAEQQAAAVAFDRAMAEQRIIQQRERMIPQANLPALTACDQLGNSPRCVNQ